MDGLQEIIKAENQVARLKLEAEEEAAALIRAAEAYREARLEEARAEGAALTRRLLGEAEEGARSEAGRRGAEEALKLAGLRSAAEAKLERAAAYIAERIAKG